MIIRANIQSLILVLVEHMAHARLHKYSAGREGVLQKLQFVPEKFQNNHTNETAIVHFSIITRHVEVCIKTACKRECKDVLKEE